MHSQIFSKVSHIPTLKKPVAQATISQHFPQLYRRIRVRAKVLSLSSSTASARLRYRYR